MNEINYKGKHFVSGTYRGKLTHQATKVSTPMFATLHFDPETHKLSGQTEDHESGRGEVNGEYNEKPPYDFRLKKDGLTYHGFKQSEDLIGKWKNQKTGATGLFQLRLHMMIAPAKLSREQDMSQEETIQELVSMGFPEDRVRSVVVGQGLQLSAAAAALTDGADAPGAEVGGAAVPPGDVPPTREEVLASFESMGFARDLAEAALSASDDDVEKALQLLLAQQDGS
eukprot:TRINITY_DN3969_c0_g11_i1.p2 TRINITY_DN3969_c0_g11~~TRINITY_DN3969_c0_g11_i1.p2  ORF type:complete len:227 (+),score=75.57 TRINITY_DN3969_c0_g11_i1:92-772(+)